VPVEAGGSMFPAVLAPRPHIDEPVAPPAPGTQAEPEVDGAGPGPAPLPTRTPRRMAPTTAPAAAGTWRPATLPTASRAGPPPPPDGVDPETGEPDPQVYRKWLKDWLDYVESQP
jgi:hypothetical protein